MLRKYLALILLSTSFICPTRSDETQILSSVVKIFTVKSQPDYHEPWQNYPQSSITGSGCIIADKQILTNAHVTADQTFIMVRKQGDSRKYIARVIAYGHECDLALLTVDTPQFFEKMQPVEIGKLPKLQDTVTVLGYPMGGDNISITQGVVSRVEPTVYSHSGRTLLSVQIDAAINPGNSGGPVIKDGKLVGVAFQGIKSGENMGYMVPVPIIKHFLEDIKDGKINGFPDIDISVTTMENPDLRKWAGMTDEQSGVIISELPPLEGKKGVLKLNDVIMAIDGIKIANDGQIPFRKNEVIFFGNLIWNKHVGDICKFVILRDREEIEVDYKLELVKKLVSERQFGRLPSYYIFGGLVFVPLVQNYLDAWRRNSAPRLLLYYVDKGRISEKKDQVVVLTKVLADDVNIGYQDLSFEPVSTVNGIKVKNLRHLMEIIENLKAGFVKISLEDHISVVLDVENARQAASRILTRYRIDASRSADLQK